MIFFQLYQAEVILWRARMVKSFTLLNDDFVDEVSEKKKFE